MRTSFLRVFLTVRSMTRTPLQNVRRKLLVRRRLQFRCTCATLIGIFRRRRRRRLNLSSNIGWRRSSSRIVRPHRHLQLLRRSLRSLLVLSFHQIHLLQHRPQARYYPLLLRRLLFLHDRRHTSALQNRTRMEPASQSKTGDAASSCRIRIDRNHLVWCQVHKVLRRHRFRRDSLVLTHHSNMQVRVTHLFVHISLV